MPEKAVAFVSFRDKAGRDSAFETLVSVANAKLFVAAADEAAADLTLVGDLLLKAAALSDGNVVDKGVRFTYSNENVAIGTNYRGNKFVFRISGSGRRFVRSIPARKTALQPDGTIEINVASGAQAFQDFKAAFEAVALDVNGQQATIVNAYVND